MRQIAVMVTMFIPEDGEPTVTVDSSFSLGSEFNRDYAASVLDRGSQLLRGVEKPVCTCASCTLEREAEAAKLLRQTIEQAKGGPHA